MDSLKTKIDQQLKQIKNNGLYKNERLISSQQGSEILVNDHWVLNFCANNYLGLSNNKSLIKKDLNDLIDAGLGLSAASKYLAKKNGLKKSEVYNLI